VPLQKYCGYECVWLEATKASSIVSTKIAVAWPVSGKKEEKDVKNRL